MSEGVCSGIDDDLQTAIQRAQQSGIAESSAWMTLLHVKPSTVTGTLRSQTDDQQFFLHPEGAIDAQAELYADLRAFFSFSSDKPGTVHAQCRFPARLYFLKKHLQLAGQLPRVSCPKRDEWMKKMATHRLSLVFPSMYLHNPASLFGHTFLRFDKQQHSILLSYALNYGARFPKDDNALVFVFNGLTGGYPGAYSMQAYYELVGEYSDIENRDIWEYDLNLNKDEIEQLLRHVWEVSGIEFDYYFLRQNCSYQLLSLLAVARPHAFSSREDPFRVYALPVDTVRATIAAGLVTRVSFRPSLYSELQHKLGGLNIEEIKLAVAMADGGIPVKNTQFLSLTQQRQITVYELAYGIVQFRGESANPLAHRILAERSQLPATETSPVHAPRPPHTGHASARVVLAAGKLENRSFVDISIRPALHDLLDSGASFVRGAEINVLNTRLRVLEDETFRLEQLIVIGVNSLSPVTPWSMPLSWGIQLGYEKQYLANNLDAGVTTLGSRLGFSWARQDFSLYVAALANFDISRDFDRDYAFRLGAGVGGIVEINSLRVQLDLTADDSVAGFREQRVRASVGIQYDISKTHALRLGLKEVAHRADVLAGFNESEWSVGVLWYF